MKYKLINMLHIIKMKTVFKVGYIYSKSRFPLYCGFDMKMED